MLATTSTTNMRCFALRHNFFLSASLNVQPGAVNNYKQNVRTKNCPKKAFLCFIVIIHHYQV